MSYTADRIDQPLSRTAAFWLAVLTPTGLTMLLVILPAIGFGGLAGLAYGLVAAGPIAFAINVLGAFVIGLPLTRFLSSRSFESGLAYGGVGFIAGTAIVMGLMSALAGWSADYMTYAMLFGGSNGLISGCVWWTKYRRFSGEDRPAITNDPDFEDGWRGENADDIVPE